MTPIELVIIVGMAIATWATRVGGLFASYGISRAGGFTERFMKNLPAGLLAALIGPKLADGNVEIWLAAAVTIVFVWKFRNTLAGVFAGTLACALLRWYLR
ncbi:AzlD family protein [Burkholderia latens]|uniref:AzlD domain-containing protein n=1 Tax=Burkholderia latens TaxID=488446 RepID=A0A6P2JMJ6_9BURK|nr:AzlD domain-containing protein [Burkholderia latens]VWB44185.1 hypothetical protein BLA24064_01977 [Burkholderia latens]